MDKYEKLRMEIATILWNNYQLEYLTFKELEELKKNLQSQMKGGK